MTPFSLIWIAHIHVFFRISESFHIKAVNNGKKKLAIIHVTPNSFSLFQTMHTECSDVTLFNDVFFFFLF